MQNFRNKVIHHTSSMEGVDQGLRSYMMKVYMYMFIGLSVTGILAYLGIAVPALQRALFVVNEAGQIAPSGLTWVLFIAQIGIVFFLSFRINTLQASTAQLIFWAYAALMGLTLSSIFIVYTGTSLARVFLITSSTFGAMSLYGYTTKKDLTAFGSFLFMGLIGIVIASVVNIFLQSSMMQFVVSVLGVLIFTGLTAYDTQRIKEIYMDHDSVEVQSKKAIMGALALYLDFINLFLMLLRLFGDRR